MEFSRHLIKFHVFFLLLVFEFWDILILRFCLNTTFCDILISRFDEVAIIRDI